MKVLSLIKDAALCLLAFASMYVFGAVMFGWPFIEYLTPERDIDKSITITAIPLPKSDKAPSTRDSRVSTCIDETGKRVSCT